METKNKPDVNNAKPKISWWRTSFGDEEIGSVSKSIHNEHISMGAVTEEFENQIAKTLGVPYVLATPSGSDSLLMAMIALDLKYGDEVIVPDRTWIATAHAPMLLGAKIRFVDSLSDNPNLDVSKIEGKITARTKAIIPVHLNGRSVQMDRLSRIAEKYGLKIVEDACQAIFSKNSRGYLGTQSDIGCLSLSIAKLISTGQGGILVTKKKEMYEKLKLIRTHGVVDTIRPVYSTPGFNFKFPDILSSIGIVQLAKIKEKALRAAEIYKTYEEGIENLPFISIIPVNASNGGVPIYAEVLCDHRKKVADYLFSKGIETRPFLPSLSTAPYFKNDESFPHSNAFGEGGLVLPCGPSQPSENINYVIKTLKSFKNET